MSLGRARRHEEISDARGRANRRKIFVIISAHPGLWLRYSILSDVPPIYVYGNFVLKKNYLTTRERPSLSSFPFSASTAKLEFARIVVPLLARKFFTNMHDCRDALVSRHINHVGAGIRGASLSTLPYASRYPSYPAGILLCILTISTDTLPLSHGGQSYR